MPDLSKYTRTRAIAAELRRIEGLALANRELMREVVHRRKAEVALKKAKRTTRNCLRRLATCRNRCGICPASFC